MQKLNPKVRFPFYILCIFLIACNGSGRDKKVKSSAIVPSPIIIEIDGNQTLFTRGDSVGYSIDADKTIPENAEPMVYLDDSLLNKYAGFPIRLKIGTANLGTGSHTLRVSLQHNNKLEGKSSVFTLLSDITPTLYTYEIVKEYPHDPRAYTQGLIFHDGLLYEGTGQTGASNLRKVTLETGKIIQQVDIDKTVFGEGIAMHNGRVYQLSWTSNVGFIFNPSSLEESGRFYFKDEGWGLTSDSTYLIKSNGTHRLTFHRSDDFAEQKAIEAYTDKKAITSLNELEYINGKIYANVWRTDDIVIIDPATGIVEGIIELKGILPSANLPDDVDVLNGIAFDARLSRIFVTGKYWPKLFEIKVVPKKLPA